MSLRPIRIAAAADSRGAAVEPGGLSNRDIVPFEEMGKPIPALLGVGFPGMSGLQLFESVRADVLCEASPAYVCAGGEPGLSHYSMRARTCRYCYICNLQY